MLNLPLVWRHMWSPFHRESSQEVSLSLLCTPCILYILYLHVIMFLISYEDSVVLLSFDYFLLCPGSEVVPVSQRGPVQPSPHLQDPLTGSQIPPF